MANIKQIHVNGDTYDFKDEVARNGLNALTQEVEGKQGAITTVTASVDSNVGTPSVTPTWNNGTLDLAFSNIKGETGATGPAGPQGDSVLVGQGDLPLAHVLGNDNTKAISQKGVTDILSPMEDLTSELEDGFWTGDINATPSKNTAYGSTYKSLRVEVENGQEYTYNLKSSNSGKCWLKLKDGKVIEKSPESANTESNNTIICDGTFDEIIFNTQNGYASKSIICSVPFIDNTNRYIQELQTAAEKLISEVDLTSEFVNGFYPTYVGNKIANAPNTAYGTTYTSFRTDKVYKGLIYEINVKAAASGRAWAKIKNGIIIAVSNDINSQQFTETVECDETFDELVVNSYTGASHSVILKRTFTNLTNDVALESLFKTVKKNVGNINHLQECVDVNMPYNDIPLPRNPEELKILAIGNSFTQNTFGYLYDMLEGLGVNTKVSLGMTVAAGRKLSEEVSSFDNDTTVGAMSYNDKGGVALSVGNVTIKQALDYKDWDVIVLQQASADSANQTSYAALGQLINRIRLYSKNRPKIVFNLTWSVGNATGQALGGMYKMYLALMDVAHMLRDKYKIDMVIPLYQSFQQVRVDDVGADMEDLLDSSSYHANGYGQVVATLTLIESLVGIPFNKSIRGVTYRNTYLTEENAATLIQLVRMACAYPYNVIPESTEEEES